MTVIVGFGDEESGIFGGIGAEGPSQETLRWRRMLETIRRRRAWAADESESARSTALAAENDRLRAGIVMLAELLLRKGVFDEADVGHVLAAIAPPEPEPAVTAEGDAEPTSADLDELGRLARVAER